MYNNVSTYTFTSMLIDTCFNRYTNDVDAKKNGKRLLEQKQTREIVGEA